jgi:hypothetical protein
VGVKQTAITPAMLPAKKAYTNHISGSVRAFFACRAMQSVAAHDHEGRRESVANTIFYKHSINIDIYRSKTCLSLKE